MKKQNLVANVQMIESTANCNSFIFRLDLSFWFYKNLHERLIIQVSNELPKTWEIMWWLFEEIKNKGDWSQVRVLSQFR